MTPLPMTPVVLSFERRVSVTPLLFSGAPESTPAKHFDEALRASRSAMACHDHLDHATFCDYLIISQEHFTEGANSLPVISNGRVVSYDIDDLPEYETLKRLEHKGSYDSKMYIKCDGNRVEFRGNPSHFNRPDNVFGYSFIECLAIINKVLASLDLPPFTAGVPMETVKKNRDSQVKWTGAVISRIDITKNFFTGSAENAHHFLQFCATQKLKAKETKVYGNYETIEYGCPAKTREYFKIYNKAVEIVNNYKYKKDKIESESFRLQNPNFSMQRVIYFCESVGLVRAELSLKTKKLQDMRCYYLGELNMNVINVEFKKHTSVFERVEADIDELAFQSKGILGIYRMWQAGDILKDKFKKSQLYKHRRELLAYGIDIFIACNIHKLEQKTRVIALSAAVMPDWYSMPAVNLKVA